MNLLVTVIDNLSYFDNEQDMLMMLSSSEVQELDNTSKGVLADMILSIDDTSNQEKKDWINDALKDIVNYGVVPPLFRGNVGENLSIRIDLEEGRDFTGFNITVRNASDGSLMGPDDIQGDSWSNEPTQFAKIDNLSITEGDFVKAHVLLEETDDQDLATGEAVTLLTDAYIFAREDIDNVS